MAVHADMEEGLVGALAVVAFGHVALYNVGTFWCNVVFHCKHILSSMMRTLGYLYLLPEGTGVVGRQTPQREQELWIAKLHIGTHNCGSPHTPEGTAYVGRQTLQREQDLRFVRHPPEGTRFARHQTPQREQDVWLARHPFLGG